MIQKKGLTRLNDTALILTLNHLFSDKYAIIKYRGLTANQLYSLFYNKNLVYSFQ